MECRGILADVTVKVHVGMIRDELARLLRNLRANHYEYCTFHSVKKDIFEFFEWVRKNRYTLAIHGTLFDFAPNRGRE